MRLFLDTEFNGWGGGLISLALVPEDPGASEFYRELDCRECLDPWVKQNVVPLLDRKTVAVNTFQQELAQYLSSFDSIRIVADWPDDIRYFCESLITGPGEIINLPSPIEFELDLDIRYYSERPHHALYDARAIRDVYLANPRKTT